MLEMGDDMKKDISIANMYRYVCMADDSSRVVQISCRIVKMTLLPLRTNLMYTKALNVLTDMFCSDQ